MIIKNVKIYMPDQKFVSGDIVTDGDRIEKILPGGAVEESEAETVDGEGCYCLPGMIDLHFHGCKGMDVCDGTKEALDTIASYEASIGVTAIAPATMTLPVEELESVLSNAAEYKKSQENGTAVAGADLVGINMEGPFISKVKKGAQDERNILPCSTEIYKRFQKAASGLVKLIGVAPE